MRILKIKKIIVGSPMAQSKEYTKYGVEFEIGNQLFYLEAFGEQTLSPYTYERIKKRIGGFISDKLFEDFEAMKNIET